MRAFALVNPASGDTRWSSVLPELRRTCDDVHVVRRGDDLAGLVQRAVTDGAEVVVAVGGDGTMSAVADVTAVTDTPVVVVPTGTRNHFAVDLGLDPSDPLRTLRASWAGEERRVDVGDVDGGIFLNNVSFGVYARAVRDPSYRNGRLTTLAAYARRAMAGHGHRVEVRTRLPADVPADARVGAILVSNNAYDFFAAPGAKLRSCLDAGELWVYLLGLPRFRRPFPVLRAVSEVVAAGSFTVGAWPTSEQVVHTDRSLPVAEDGEYRHDLAPPYRLSIRPGALRVLAPARGSAPRSLTLRW